MSIYSADHVPSLSLADQERAATYLERGWWQAKSLPDYLDEHVAAGPDRVFATDDINTLTYAELRGQAYRFAAALRGLGVQTGDRVVVQLPNWTEFTVAYLGLTRLGAVLVPIMPIYRQHEVEYLLQHSRAVAAVTSGSFRSFDFRQMYRNLRSTCPDLRHVIVARGNTAGDTELAFNDLARPQAVDVPGLDELGPGPTPDAPHAIVYTSGTESRPKGCCHSWYSVGYNVRGLTDRTLQLTSSDVMFMPSPVTHSTGLVLGVGVPLAAGAAVHLMDVWEPSDGLRRIEKYGCTATATATPFVRMALSAYVPGQYDASRMRVWLCAGAPIPPALVTEMSQVWPDCRMLPLWGCSEVFGGSVCSLDDPLSATVNSDGKVAFPGVELKILGPDGKDAPVGVEGELCYRGPGKMLGYWADPERTAAAVDQNGWYHTADLARMDDEGYVRITGRIKDIIIRGGANISAREIEDQVVAHPKVEAAAAVGVPDDVLGERVFLFVVPTTPQEPPSFEDIIDFLKREQLIAPNKLPEKFMVIDELPMTASGKIQKFQLRKTASDQ